MHKFPLNANLEATALPCQCQEGAAAKVSSLQEKPGAPLGRQSKCGRTVTTFSLPLIDSQGWDPSTQEAIGPPEVPQAWRALLSTK